MTFIHLVKSGDPNQALRRLCKATIKFGEKVPPDMKDDFEELMESLHEVI